jgi:hypothetical protein
MANLDPFHIRTETDPDCRYRIRWVVWDPFAGIFKSTKNFATEREALYDADRFIDRRETVWQRKMSKPPKRPRDINQWAKRMVEIATGEVDDTPPTPEEQGKDPAAVALGRKGGLKGGKARAASMTPERRAEIARKAAQSRWKP